MKLSSAVFLVSTGTSPSALQGELAGLTNNCLDRCGEIQLFKVFHSVDMSPLNIHLALRFENVLALVFL